MKKLVMCLAALLLLIPTAVFAAEIETPVPKLGEEDNLIVSGSTDLLEGEKLTVSIFRTGKTYATITDFGAASDDIAYVGVARVDEGGAYTLEWTPLESGNYDIYLAGGGRIIAVLKNRFLPAGLATLYRQVETASQAELATLFGATDNRRALLMDDTLFGEISDSAALGGAVYNLRQALPGTSDTYEYIRAAALLQLLSEGGQLSVMEEYLTALYGLGLHFSQEANYDTYATDAIKRDMAVDMTGASSLNMEALDTYFTDRLILSGVAKSSNWMDGLDFLNILGYPVDASKRETAAKALTGTKYSTIAALKTAIDSAAGDTSTVTRPSSSGGRSGGSSRGGGAGTDVSGITVPVNVDESISTIQDMNYIFADVERSHYAFDDINYLRWHEIISGDENGNFNPDNPITRAEIVKMLCGIFGIETAEQKCFEDVSASDWFYGYVGGAHKSELVLGDENGNFYPNDPVTREDLVVMVWRFAAATGQEFAAQTADFTDVNCISDYAVEAVGALTNAGMINGMGDGSFAPKDNASRAQAAAMLARCMRNLGKE